MRLILLVCHFKKGGAPYKSLMFLKFCFLKGDYIRLSMLHLYIRMKSRYHTAMFYSAVSIRAAPSIAI